MRFGENNNSRPKYIDIYKFGGYGGGVHIPPYIFCLLFKKNGKSARALPIIKSNSTSFRFKDFFPRMNNKNFTTMGPQGAPLVFHYKVSMLF